MEEFAYLQLRKSDLLDLHRALLGRWLTEDKLRQSQGLESVGPPTLLDRIETLIGLDESQAHTLFHRVEDELWEYSWYSYTEEWAWHRAEQDIKKELGSSFDGMNKDKREELIERRYETSFDKYLAEVSIDEETKITRSKKSNVKTSKK